MEEPHGTPGFPWASTGWREHGAEACCRRPSPHPAGNAAALCGGPHTATLVFESGKDMAGGDATSDTAHARGRARVEEHTCMPSTREVEAGGLGV